MFNEIKKTIEWGHDKLTLETGKIARQADSTVMATYGETVVMAAVVFAKEAKADQDFFPLTVNYQEKYYAAGKIPGGFFKREARPTEKETLTSRLIDRPIRPLFVEGFKNEVQVTCTVLSHDLENDPDIVAMIAASAALTLSGAPFLGPIGAARVGFVNGSYVLNPSVDDMDNLKEKSDQRLDLVVAGTKDAVMMVESEAYELSEKEMLGAVKFGHEQMASVIDMIIDLAKEAAKEPFSFDYQLNDELYKKISKAGNKDLKKAFEISDKKDRQASVASAVEKIKSSLSDEENEGSEVKELIKRLESEVVRNNILDDGLRIDGRDLTTVRQIETETRLLPRAHGSALFTRGETQGLVVTTLGSGDSEQIVDALHKEGRLNFMLHYNFPPYSVGECGRMMGPGRREIGHGKLAWRALQAVLPSSEEFPYTVRVVSEITESNGSSSMATVCGSSLSMMDAGVPLKAPVAGVAMGLILEGKKFAVLTDILGDEDHLGDMDFKVAGTEAGITSLQMDIKVAGITPQIMEKALDQAKEARLHILGEMAKSLSAPSEFSQYAPKIESITVPSDKIREVIGSGGKVIKEIVEVSGAKVDINDDGLVRIASQNKESLDTARKMIKEIVEDPIVGQVYEGKVVKLMDFGAFVNFYGKRDGLVHVSQISEDRVNHPKDVLNEGETVKVKLMGIDDRGKSKLSMKVIDQSTGKEIEKES
ncbi:MAG: polyribonucleotide nucleotidyltransferase [Paracoccaceae bacterium]|jgi:polyribonucleotide nucleotidyltransferase|tara:strand:- start:7 stop:2127 length:2121 start_codon:yes stop_codon:yes gene_type:complete